VIGQQQSANWSYFGYDGLGSVRQVTNSTGVVGYSANYDPYGNPLEQFGTLPTNLGFTGEYTDPSGQLYLRARYANPSTGTFLTRDPFEGYMQRAMSRNGYSYVEGNPVNYRDPSGKEIVTTIVVTVVVVAILSAIAAQAWNNFINNRQVQECIADLSREMQDLLKHRGVEGYNEPLTPLTSPLIPITIPPFDSPISTPVPGSGPWVDPIVGNPPIGETAFYTIPKPSVSNPALQDLINVDYPPNAQVGNGSTADAIIETKNTGNLVGGSDHIREGIDLRRAYSTWIRRQRNTFPEANRASNTVSLRTGTRTSFEQNNALTEGASRLRGMFMLRSFEQMFRLLFLQHTRVDTVITRWQSKMSDIGQ